jgi:hypothetical protein
MPAAIGRHAWTLNPQKDPMNRPIELLQLRSIALDQSREWRVRWDAFVSYAHGVRAITKRVKTARDDRAYRLGATVGLPRHALCIHNAALDKSLTGWCKDNPQRYRVAKRVNHMLCDWKPARLGDALIDRAYPRTND